MVGQHGCWEVASTPTNLVQVHVVDVLSAVVHAEGIAGEDSGGGMVVGEDRVGPVEVGRDDELEQVASAEVNLEQQRQHWCTWESSEGEGPSDLGSPRSDDAP